MKYIIILVVTLSLCLHTNAEDCFSMKASKEEMSHIPINRAFTKCDTILSLPMDAISGLGINGSFEKNSDDYLIRIILIDKAGNEHLVMESCDMLNSDFKVTMNDYCEETAYLENVNPDYIKVIVHDAILIINDIVFTTKSNRDSRQTNEREAQKAKLKQEQRNSIIKRINTYNATYGRPWIAGKTSLSDKSYADKKRLLGFSDDIATGGYEYYSDGFFLVGNLSNVTNTRSTTSSLYVNNFDWRNRHGKNWVTPVKDQKNSNYCFAFSTTACVESAYMLYYNDTTTIDLSEQEAACCTHSYYTNTYIKGGYADSVLMYIQNYGIFDEQSYPFYESGYQHCRSSYIDYDEDVRISGYERLGDDSNDDFIKSKLIHYGPLVSGYWWHEPDTTVKAGGHLMLLVGYGTISAGDIIRIHKRFGLEAPSPVMSNLVGKTYWIFKNSYGLSDDAYLGGYQHIVFEDAEGYPHNKFMNWTYNINYPIISLNKTDNDIICEDTDGDGYYFWGLGPKPANCPSGVHDTPDGDDSNSLLGPMNQFGYLTDLSNLSSQTVISGNTTYSTNMTMSNNTVVIADAKLTITGTVNMASGVKLTVHYNGTIVVDGGILQNADLALNSGCHVIVKNGGNIIMRSGKQFEAPLGTTVDILNGEIQ